MVYKVYFVQVLLHLLPIRLIAREDMLDKFERDTDLKWIYPPQALL